ncbi:MAG TPA: alanine--tRNA ligase [Candidatus Krumholzibacteriaceae bacterium]|nr:alanine--tRNA ligase [Candidatus Krumholzibacteriaceae bacterium]
MKRKSAHEIRRTYIDFFVNKNHTEVPSASLAPKNDPTLLFTSAGMVQFKDRYIDTDGLEYKRAVSVQKCLRAGDLENVGKTLRHHTFFEMLGNFSFGDYFKRDAILWAWEFVVEVLQMPADRIYISIFNDDDDAFNIWNKEVGISDDRIFRLGKEDNFWGPVGETGICGPCSELYYDSGEKNGCGREDCAPGCDCDRYIEFWNLVFPEYWLEESGEYKPLEKPGIDTGLGLERMATILQGVEDNFHTDLFKPIVEKIITILPSDAVGGKDDRMGVNMIADHVRALTFALAEGIYPSNEGRGYLIRRVLRKALTRMYMFGVRKPCLYKIVDPVVEVMKEDYPELDSRYSEVKKVLRSGEESFFRTLISGRERFFSVIEQIKDKGGKRLDGDNVFLLYDTHGFPLELMKPLAGEAGIEIDEEGFNKAMERQKMKARKGSSFGAAPGEKIHMEEITKGESSEFTGYESLSESAVLRKFREVSKEAVENIAWSSKEETAYEFIFDKTPFYAISGGQVADRGWISFGGTKFEVKNVFYRNNEIIHLVESSQTSGEIDIADLSNNPALLEVDRELRTATEANHTSTHLLHAALKDVLGEHIAQAGSFVSEDRLRFDFNHFEAISPEQKRRIELIINAWIRESIDLRTEIMSYKKAVKDGATALFDEKYGNKVRVVKIKGVSAELCGGTHADSTGNIGLFLIVHQSSIAAGVRRIEAVTGSAALEYVRGYISDVEETADLLKASRDEIAQKIKFIIDENAKLKRRIKELQRGDISNRINQIIESSDKIDNVILATGRIDVDEIAALRAQADLFRKNVASGIAVLSMSPGEKLHFIVAVTDDLVERGVEANIIVDRLKDISGGGGGGRKHLAQLGTKKIGKEKDVFKALAPIARDIMS